MFSFIAFRIIIQTSNKIDSLLPHVPDRIPALDVTIMEVHGEAEKNHCSSIVSKINVHKSKLSI